VKDLLKGGGYKKTLRFETKEGKLEYSLENLLKERFEEADSVEERKRDFPRSKLTIDKRNRKWGGGLGEKVR